MTIDGVDIATYNARQWTVQPGFSSLENKSEWIAGTLSPFMLKSTTGLKSMKVTVTIRGSTRQEIWSNAQRLVSSLLEPKEIRLDGFDHIFFMYLKNASQAERSLNRWHKATLELVGYEYGDEISMVAQAETIVINNMGNLVTPAVIEIVPVIDQVSIAVSGVVRDAVSGEDKPIIIKELTKGKTIVIDGENGLITEDGINKFPDTEIWDLPSLLPGINTITVNKYVQQMRVKYKPRFI